VERELQRAQAFISSNPEHDLRDAAVMTGRMNRRFRSASPARDEFCRPQIRRDKVVAMTAWELIATAANPARTGIVAAGRAPRRPAEYLRRLAHLAKEGRASLRASSAAASGPLGEWTADTTRAHHPQRHRGEKGDTLDFLTVAAATRRATPSAGPHDHHAHRRDAGMPACDALEQKAILWIPRGCRRR